jgi:asparagine synthase (glutamine-hydrolysing)
MSGIAGVFNRNGQPVAPEVLRRMTVCASHRGPDGAGSWLDGPVGLSQLLLATTPEAAGETAPLLDPESGSCVVFDGRLDNRDELIRALDAHGIGRRGDTDMELVLSAWTLWNTGCAARLLGDFAFAVWDARQRRLFCARDHSSVKPFYYFCSDDVFAFASEVSQVLQHPQASREVNEGMVGELLACAYVSRDETLYRDVFRLPAAHSLLVDAAGLRVGRFWDIDPARRLVYRRDAEYVEHFEAIFRDAVACRLRSNGKVGVTLSGGLDSTSVAGMAQSIFDAQREGRRLESFSLVYPGRDCDESALIDEVVRKWSLVAHSYAFTRFTPAPAWSEQVRHTLMPPEYPTLSALTELHRIARANGVRVLLSGAGASTWLGGSEYPHLGLLRDGRIGALVDEIRVQAREHGWRRAMSRASRSLLWPLLPSSAKRALEASRVRHSRLEFLDSDFIRRIGLAERMRRHDSANRFSDLAQWSVCNHGLSAVGTFYRESEDRTNARNGIEERHPFWDRRLVEFAAAIPGHVHQRGGRGKQLLRGIGGKLLPPTVHRNPAQTEVGCVFVEALRDEAVEQAACAMTIADRGWVAGDRVRSARQAIADSCANGLPIPDDAYRALIPLWMAFAVECWRRECGERGPCYPKNDSSRVAADSRTPIACPGAKA